MVSSVAIIGGGIVGTATAEWCRRAGFKVTLLDRVAVGEMSRLAVGEMSRLAVGEMSRLAVGDEAMASYGNAGILAAAAVIPVPVPGLIKKLPFYLFSKRSPLFVNWADVPRLSAWLWSYLRHAKTSEVARISENLTFLLQDSVEQHFALAKGTAAEKFLRRSDYYYLFHREEDFHADGASWNLRKSLGYDWRELDGAALRRLDSNIGDFYNFAVALPNHGFVADPGGYVAALQSHFVACGGSVACVDVSDIRAHGDRVEIRGADYVADFDKCVIAGGVHSEALARALGLASGIVRESGYHLFLSSPSFMPPAPFMLNEGKCVLTPMRDGLRIAGLVEFGGGERVSSRAVDFLSESLRRAYPGLEYGSMRVWRGHRPSTPDSLPLLGVHPRYGNIYFACGHQHIGLTAGAKTGWLLSRLLDGELLNCDLGDFSPDRFS